MIKQYLDYLENRLNPDVENQIEAEWNLFLDGKHPDEIFSPQRPAPIPPQLTWPEIFINDAFEDMELMLLRELAQLSKNLESASGDMHNIRCNYSTAIMPSLFGLEIFYMERQLNTLPTSMPVPGGTEDIKRLLDQGVPDLNRGLAPKVFETLAYYRDMLKDYPKIQRYTRIYHPDFQGPADVLEMIWGSPFFMELYDNPQLVKDFLDIITQTYINFMTEWNKQVPPSPHLPKAHWAFGHRGQIALRNDSIMNLSPEMYEEFFLPHDRRLLEIFHGGIVHFCGRGDHYIDLLAGIPELTGIQLSQPHYNDMEKIFSHTVDKGIPLLALRYETSLNAIKQGRDLHHLVHSRK